MHSDVDLNKLARLGIGRGWVLSGAERVQDWVPVWIQLLILVDRITDRRTDTPQNITFSTPLTSDNENPSLKIYYMPPPRSTHSICTQVHILPHIAKTNKHTLCFTLITPFISGFTVGWGRGI